MGNYAEELETLYREPENLYRKGCIQPESRGIKEHILEGSRLGQVFREVESPAASPRELEGAQCVENYNVPKAWKVECQD